MVQGTKDAPTPRPNKRPRLELAPSEYERHRVQSSKQLPKKVTADPSLPQSSKGAQYQEFAKVMQSRSKKGPSWANDDEHQPVASTSTLPAQASKRTSVAEREVDPTSSDGVEDVNQGNGLSDVDWLKRHQRSAVETLDSENITVFDQSDEDHGENVDGSPETVSIALCSYLCSRLIDVLLGCEERSGRSDARDDSANLQALPSQFVIRMYG